MLQGNTIGTGFDVQHNTVNNQQPIVDYQRPPQGGNGFCRYAGDRSFWAPPSFDGDPGSLVVRKSISVSGTGAASNAKNVKSGVFAQMLGTLTGSIVKNAKKTISVTASGSIVSLLTRFISGASQQFYATVALTSTTVQKIVKKGQHYIPKVTSTTVQKLIKYPKHIFPNVAGGAMVGNPAPLTNVDCEADVPMLNGANVLTAVTAAVSTDRAHSGTHSLKITTTAVSANPRKYALGNVSTMNGLIPGHTYTFKAWLYIPSGQGISPLPYVQFSYRDSRDGNWFTISGNNASATDSWVQSTTTGNIPTYANAIVANIRLQQDIQNVVFYADDIELYETGSITKNTKKTITKKVTAGKPDAIWLSGYNYRKSHVINASADGSLVNYQVSLTINKGAGTDSLGNIFLGNLAQSWTSTVPNDLRFTNASGVELDYWIQSSDANTATVWVEVDSIPNPAGATVYIYYGKTGDTTTSSIINASMNNLGDDFDDQSLSASWTKANEAAGKTISETATPGYLQLTISSQMAGWYQAMPTCPYIYRSIGATDGYEIMVLHDVNPAAVYDGSQVVVCDGSQLNSGVFIARLRDDPGQVVDKSQIDGTGNESVLESATTDVLLRIRKMGNWSFSYSTNGGTSYTNVGSSFAKSFSNHTFALACATQTVTSVTVNYNWAFIRKFTTNEPAHGSTGAVESSMPVLVKKAQHYIPKITSALLPANSAFTRASAAYLNSGTQVASGAVRLDGTIEGATNILTVNQAGLTTDTTGFGKNQGTETISIDTGTQYRVIGSGAMKCITPNLTAFEGVDTTTRTVVQGQIYTGSVWLCGSGNVRIVLNEGGQMTWSGTFTLTATPTRYSVTRTATTTSMQLLMLTSSQQGITFYASGLQLEQNDHATPWVPGTATRLASVAGLTVEEGTTNLLTANQAALTTDTTGFAQNASTISRDIGGANRIMGAAALKSITNNAGIGEGFSQVSTVVAASQPYTASCWLCGAGTVILSLKERDTSDVWIAQTDSSIITLTATPTRYSVSRTFGGSGVHAMISVTTNVQQGITFYASGLQLEQKSAATSWQHTGAGVRNAEVFAVPTAGIMTPEQGTIELLVNVTPTMLTCGRNAYLFSTLTGNNWISLRRSTDTKWYFNVRDSASTDNTSSTAGDLTAGLHRFGCKWSSAEVSFFIDGVKVPNIDTTVSLPNALGANIYLGGYHTTGNESDSQVSDVVFSMVARSDAELAARGVNTPLGYDANTSYYLPLKNDLNPSKTNIGKKISHIFSKITAKPNAVANSDFETNTTGWTVYSPNGSSTIVQSNDWAATGTYSLKVTAGASDSYGDAIYAATNPTMKTLLGGKYIVTVTIKSVQAQNIATYLYSSSGAIQYGKLTTTFLAGDVKTITFPAVIHTADGAQPQGIRLEIWNPNGVTGNVFYIDDVHIEPFVSLLPKKTVKVVSTSVQKAIKKAQHYIPKITSTTVQSLAKNAQHLIPKVTSTTAQPIPKKTSHIIPKVTSTTVQSLVKKAQHYIPKLTSTTVQNIVKKAQHYIPKLTSTTVQSLAKKAQHYIPKLTSTTTQIISGIKTAGASLTQMLIAVTGIISGTAGVKGGLSSISPAGMVTSGTTGTITLQTTGAYAGWYRLDFNTTSGRACWQWPTSWPEHYTVPNGATVTFSMDFVDAGSGNVMLPSVGGDNGLGYMSNVGGTRYAMTWTNNTGADKRESIYIEQHNWETIDPNAGVVYFKNPQVVSGSVQQPYYKMAAAKVSHYIPKITTTSNTGLAGYANSKKITLNHSGAISGYQKKLYIVKGAGTDSGDTIYLNDAVQAWPNDIRFTTSDGKTLLDFWREENDAADGTWWVEYDQANGNTDIYLYYGKSGDSDASSGTNTFPVLFDDFADLSKWDTDSGAPSVASSELTLTMPGTTTAQRVLSKATFNSDVRIRMKAKHAHWGDSNYREHAGFFVDTSNYLTLGMCNGGGDGSTAIVYGKGATTYAFAIDLDPGHSNAETGVYHTYEIMRYSNDGVAGWYDADGTVKTSTGSWFPTGPYKLVFEAATGSAYTNSSVVADWVFVGTYAATEPTVTTGAAQLVATGMNIVRKISHYTQISMGAMLGNPAPLTNANCEADVPMLNGANVLTAVTAATSTEQAHSGTHSLKITTTAVSANPRKYVMGISTNSMNGLIAGHSYTIRGWLYVPNGQGITANPYLQFSWRSKIDGNWTTISTAGVSQRDQWVQVSTADNIPVYADAIVGVIRLNQDIQNVYFYADDIEIFETGSIVKKAQHYIPKITSTTVQSFVKKAQHYIPKVTSTTVQSLVKKAQHYIPKITSTTVQKIVKYAKHIIPKVTAKSNDENRVGNPDFEIDATGWGVYSNSGTSSIASSTDWSATGTRSLKCVVGGSDTLVDAMCIGGGINGNLHGTPGQKFYVQATIKAVQAQSIRVQLFSNPSYIPYGMVGDGSPIAFNAGEVKTIAFTATCGSEPWMRLEFWNSGVSPGVTFYIDDVHVTALPLNKFTKKGVTVVSTTAQSIVKKISHIFSKITSTTKQVIAAAKQAGLQTFQVTVAVTSTTMIQFAAYIGAVTGWMFYQAGNVMVAAPIVEQGIIRVIIGVASSTMQKISRMTSHIIPKVTATTAQKISRVVSHYIPKVTSTTAQKISRVVSHYIPKVTSTTVQKNVRKTSHIFPKVTSTVKLVINKVAPGLNYLTVAVVFTANVVLQRKTSHILPKVVSTTVQKVVKKAQHLIPKVTSTTVQKVSRSTGHYIKVVSTSLQSMSRFTKKLVATVETPVVTVIKYAKHVVPKVVSTTAQKVVKKAQHYLPKVTATGTVAWSRFPKKLIQVVTASAIKIPRAMAKTVKLTETVIIKVINGATLTYFKTIAVYTANKEAIGKYAKHAVPKVVSTTVQSLVKKAGHYTKVTSTTAQSLSKFAKKPVVVVSTTAQKLVKYAKHAVPKVTSVTVQSIVKKVTHIVPRVASTTVQKLVKKTLHYTKVTSTTAQNLSRFAKKTVTVYVSPALAIPRFISHSIPRVGDTITRVNAGHFITVAVTGTFSTILRLLDMRTVVYNTLNLISTIITELLIDSSESIIYVQSTITDTIVVEELEGAVDSELETRSTVSFTIEIESK